MSVSRRTFIKGAGVAGATAATASAATPVSAQSAGRVNVRDHGAQGNGRTDDTAAIRRACDAANPGGTVYFPAGVFLVGKNSRRGIFARGNWRNLSFIGEGASSSTIKMAGGHANAHFVVQLEGTIGTMRFERLCLDGNKQQQSDTGLCFLSKARGGKVVIRDCRFTSAYNAGMKFSGTAEADIQFCQFDNNGFLSNGGHAISPNQDGKIRTVVRRCLFQYQGGVDIDTGHMKPDTAWQTVIVEECYFSESKRGVLKISSENSRTTVRNSVMESGGEIPVKMNPTPQDIGVIELDNVIIDGAGWPGIDLPAPGRLELNEVAIKNVNQDGQRGGGIFARGQNIQATRVSVHNVNGGSSPAVDLAGCSGRMDELIYGGVSGIGNGAGIVKSSRRGAPINPTVVSKSKVGPRGMGGSGQVSAPRPTGESAPTPTPEPPEEPWVDSPVDISFDKTVNAVDDLGMDPNEGRSITNALSNVDSGTLVRFPSGRYAIDSGRITASNVGIAAVPGETPVFVPSKPRSQSTGWVLQMISGKDFILSGIEFDFTQEGYGGGITVFSSGDAYVGDIHTRGMVGDNANGLNVAALDANGTFVVDRFVARDGSRFDSASHGLFVNQRHEGTLYVRNSEVWHWTDNGVYASSPGYDGSYRGSTNADRGNGEVHIEGGVYKNNNISNIRIGTDNSSIRGSVIETNASISGDAWSDRDYAVMPRSGTEPNPVVNTRGIWLTGRDNLSVEDVDIKMGVGPSSGGIVIRGAAGNVSLRNTRIQMNIDSPALRVAGGNQPIRVDGFSLTGSSSAPAAVFNGRGSSTIQQSCIQMPNSPGVVGLSENQITLSGECSTPDLSPSQRWGDQSQRNRLRQLENAVRTIIAVLVFFGGVLAIGLVLIIRKLMD